MKRAAAGIETAAFCCLRALLRSGLFDTTNLFSHTFIVDLSEGDKRADVPEKTFQHNRVEKGRKCGKCHIKKSKFFKNGKIFACKD